MYNMNCTILGHKKGFSVQIDVKESVSKLKNLIKATQPETLESFNTTAFELYWVQYLVPSEDDEAYETLVEPIS